ncbi:MAG: hypothetical protein ACREJN_16805 [Nitrospiraceae bacterium]
MVVDKYHFRWMYVNDFIKTVDYFAKTLYQKVLPAFDNISEEAHQAEQETYEHASRFFDPDHDDPADYAEAAVDAGIDFSIMASGMKQGVTNLFVAGLYHLFEQWFFKFHRRELLYLGEDGDLSLITWKEAKQRLFDVYAIQVEAFPSWNKIRELRLAANSVKHADGTSCEELKELRPDLFVHPSLKMDAIDSGLTRGGEVFHPLAGDDLYIIPEEFEKYVGAIKQFCEELAKSFDAYEYPKG